ncbi:aminodeoxychorismate synthase component I [Kaistia nematophila]|uniref:Probable branched-chain-amino-acid aminotransferase n=1 Tax=Kaistia nematophila TaxID=2994654 RepID=A0A9X3E3G5_9HYPH|nr:aminodeoxychorismate synthase component I [Kaistia nematophila]MCX5571059.1 aminodeoxychorismate synthase component I [Kaistia nematophila]
MPPALADLLTASSPFVLLEDRLDASATAALYADPVEIVRCYDAAAVPDAMARIEAGLGRGLHAAGFLGYELGYALQDRLVAALPAGRELPLLWFGLFREALRLGAAELDAVFGALAPPPAIADVRPRLDEAAHASKIGRVLDYLAAGDAYQINLTFPIDFRYGGDPLALYAALRANQPVAHGGIISFDGATILSVSPELFLDVSAGRATTRPMKGTVPRQADPDADRAAIDELREDPKQRAENLMIVDLLRNDLGRISEIGSVEVENLFNAETYPTFHAMASTVTSRLLPGTSLSELMQAAFPCGSITGAPKLRAMEIIRELEEDPREIYTGSIGAIAPNGDLRFNVAIRTATLLADGRGRYDVGSGVVADSHAEAEYAECLLKARVLTDLGEDYGLIETLRGSAETGLGRLDLHLDRLAASASALGFVFDRGEAEARLEALREAFGGEQDRRVRLELRRDGTLDIVAPALPPEPDRPVATIIASLQADAGDPFLRHKTTKRRLYEAAFAEAGARGADEAILVNRSGFVTEATRSNIFVEREDGMLLTPPLADGLLPGILRESLLRSGKAIERQLTPDDLVTAGRWYLGNSLRGLRPARML